MRRSTELICGWSFARGKGTPGFTLVEVLVAAAITVAALLGIMTLFPTAFLNIASGGKTSQAVTFAQARMEALKNGAFPPGAGSESVDGFTRQWTAQLVGGAAPNRLYRVTVTVSSPSLRLPVQLVTLIAE